MEVIKYALYDVVEMKKAHPCGKKSKTFQITMVGADIKIKCQTCGHLIMMDRAHFNERIRRVVSSPGVIVESEKAK